MSGLMLLDILQFVAGVMACGLLPFAMVGYPCGCNRVCSDYCDGGVYTDEIVITISNVVDLADGICLPTNCGNWNGSYTLPYSDPGNDDWCSWRQLNISDSIRVWQHNSPFGCVSTVVKSIYLTFQATGTISSQPAPCWWVDLVLTHTTDASQYNDRARYIGASDVTDCCDLDETINFSLHPFIRPTFPSCYYNSSSVEIVGQGC